MIHNDSITIKSLFQNWAILKDNSWIFIYSHTDGPQSSAAKLIAHKILQQVAAFACNLVMVLQRDCIPQRCIFFSSFRVALSTDVQKLAGFYGDRLS